MRRFVVVVDAQADFMLTGGALPVAGADALIAPMQDWLAGLRGADTAGVLFTFDTHDAATYSTSPEAAEFPIHCVKGTPGWRGMVDPAVIDAGVPLFRLEKGVFDMWAEAGVVIEDVRQATIAAAPRDRFFDRLYAGGVTQVTVIGVAADYCVRQAVAGLIARGFDVTVPAALTRGIARQIETVVADEFPHRVWIA